MAKLQRADMDKALLRAAASQEAKAHVEQAGRGLSKCFTALTANTVTPQTRYDLVIAAGYINDAIAALVKAEIDELPVGKIELGR